MKFESRDVLGPVLNSLTVNLWRHAHCSAAACAPCTTFLLHARNEAPMSELELTTIARRVRVEYDEMPGLVLTIPQAARLWRLEKSVVEHVMASLVDAEYLRQSPRGFVRRSFSH
jgi:hypothetical protein